MAVNIKYLKFVVFSFLILSAGYVLPENLSPQAITNNQLDWKAPAPIPGLQFAWVTGCETCEGLYKLKVKLNSQTKIPPHRHPDQRISTVLSGTLYVGFGDVFDEQNLVAIGQGQSYIAPADTSHFLWAKDGLVVYQETGIGPTATKLINID